MPTEMSFSPYHITYWLVQQYNKISVACNQIHLGYALFWSCLFAVTTGPFVLSLGQLFKRVIMPWNDAIRVSSLRVCHTKSKCPNHSMSLTKDWSQHCKEIFSLESSQSSRLVLILYLSCNKSAFSITACHWRQIFSNLKHTE